MKRKINVNGLILKIKEFHKKIASNVKCSLWCGFSETDKGTGVNLLTYTKKPLTILHYLEKQQKLVKKNDLKKAWNSL